MRWKLALFTAFGLAVALVVLLVVSHGALPDRIATHFDAGGRPNGWMSREAFLRFGVISVLAPVSVLYAVALLAGFIPASLVNLPHRDYWLSSERSATTRAILRVALFEFANATFAFVLFVLGSTVAANRATPPHLGFTFFLGLFAFIAFTLVWTLQLLRRFFRIPTPR